jgi:anti-sigma B factor antagonist
MDLTAREVIVIEVPAAIDAKQAGTFVRQLANRIARVVRPCVVLDCARARRVDGTFLHLLLCSLEEAMKRNGDVRLSGLPEAARPALQSMGMERLFRLYPSVAEAAESFRRPGAPVTPFTPAHDSTTQPSARAA